MTLTVVNYFFFKPDNKKRNKNYKMQLSKLRAGAGVGRGVPSLRGMRASHVGVPGSSTASSPSSSFLGLHLGEAAGNGSSD